MAQQTNRDLPIRVDDIAVRDAPHVQAGMLQGRRGTPAFYLTNEFGLLVLIVLFAIVFSVLKPGFMSAFNQFTLGRTAAINVMIGFSMMAVIVTGGLNLAVGAIGVCAAMGCGWLIEGLGLPWPLAIVGAVGLGGLLGFANGWAVVRSGLHSFIITLASMSIFFGTMVFLTHAESFRALSPVFAAFGRLRLFGSVSPFLGVAVLAGVLLTLLYRYTALGREMLAAGARPEAATLSGVHVGRITILCHMLSGGLAAVTALLVVARNGAALPSMAGQLGQDWLLPAFLGPVLGGTLLSGGRVSVSGTLLGAVLVTMLTNGLLLLQIGEFWVQACLGLLLLFAVLIDKGRRSFSGPAEGYLMPPLARLMRTDWFGPLAVTLLAIAVIGGLAPSFLSPFNIEVLLLAIAVNALIAFSQMIIIAIGQMNLAVGAIGGLAAISFAGLMQVWGWPAPVAAVTALLIGLGAGLLNGLFIAGTGISAFVITLASLSVFKGINLGITRAQPFYGVPDSVKAFGNTTFLGPLPWIAIPTALVIGLMWFLLNRLSLGRSILAVGGNPHAAELSGISVPGTIAAAHAISGLLAGLAGVMLVARLQIGQPTIGDDWLILSFAAPVIGGAALSGGHVSVAATVLGVVIVAIITQALVLFRIDPYLVQVVLGLLILWAVGVNRWREVRLQGTLRRI